LENDLKIELLMKILCHKGVELDLQRTLTTKEALWRQ